MRINFNFYSDKKIEKQSFADKIGNIIQNEKNIEELKEINELVLLTKFRENILNWYPFKSECKILEAKGNYGEITNLLCEKSIKTVTIEENKEKAQIIAQRNFKKNNLEIIVGKIEEIQLKEKFDYLVLVNEVEKLYQYINTLKKYLTEDAVVIIIANNKYGIHNFSTSDIKQQITQNEKTNISKKNLNEILNKEEFKYIKYYYPIPDYKITSEIFTDKELPNEENIKNNFMYQDELANFDETSALTCIIKDDREKFPLFANSYLIEASFVEKEDNQIQHIEFTNVKEKFKIFEDKVRNLPKEYEILLSKYYNDENELKKARKENIELMEKVREKENEIKQKEEIIEDRENQLRTIANSRSWKITKPLRTIHSKIKR